MKTTLRSHLLIHSAAFALLMSSAALAQSSAIDIPAQPLEAALKEFGVDTGAQVMYAKDLVMGRSSAAAKGTLAPDEALKIMLGGTNLRVEKSAENVYLIKSSDAARTAPRERRIRDEQPATASLQTAQVQAPLELVPARAGDAAARIDEIVVTAQFREQALRDVPMTVSLLSGDEVQQRSISSLQTLSFATPELVVFSANPGENRVFMRGMGDNGGTLPLVGLYLDEVAVSGPTSRGLDIRPLDLTRVEVLHGPQGTLYGQGSAGGTIRFITNDPSFTGTTVSASIDGAVTQDGDPSGKFVGVANLPVVEDVFALRVAGTYEHNGGWIEAPTAGRKNINGNELFSVRVKGLMRVSDNLDLTPMVVIHRNDADSTYSGENVAGDLILPLFAPATVTPVDADYNLYGLTGKLDLGGAQLLSVTSHFDNKSDGAFNNRFGVNNRRFEYRTRDHATSQELRLSSSTGDAFNWLLGAYYRDSDFNSETQFLAGPADVITVRSVIRAVEESKSWSFYGNASYELVDGLEVGGGLRYFRDRKQSPLATGGINKARFKSFDPRIYATYALTPDVKVYANFAKGFRSGGFNSINAAFPPNFKPEKVFNYETGIKFDLFDRLLTGEIAGYHTQFRNMQTVIIPPALGLGYTTNVAASRIYGLDTSLQVNLPSGTSFGGNLAVVDSKISKAPVGSDLLPGDRNNLIPTYSYTLFVRHEIPINDDVGGWMRLDYNEKGRAVFRSRTSNAFATGEIINLLNGRAGIDWSKYSIEVYGENLLNDRHQIQPSITGSFTRMRPRTIGLRLSSQF